jgi:nitrogen fixation NifU-like protein
MDDLYQDHILDHYERPRFHGTLEHPDMTHCEHNPLCGDRIQVDVRLTPDRTGIAEVAFEGEGCIISQAAASILMETVIGRSLEELQALDQKQMLALMGVPLTGARRKCALLALKALKLGVYTFLANQTILSNEEANQCGITRPLAGSSVHPSMA